MEKKQTFLHTQKRKIKAKNKDLCPVCDENLYYNNTFTRRIGVLGNDDSTVEGWMCPDCNSQFDLDNNLVQIDNNNTQHGRA